MKNEVKFSLVEFMDRFSTEEKCERELYRLKWQNGFVCPKCGHGEHFITKSRRLPLYGCKKCRHQTTVTVGTVMEKSRTPLVKWFIAIYKMSNDKRGVSAKQLQRDLMVAYQTAWSMSHKIKEAIKSRKSSMLGGIVQLDEIYVGGSKKGGKRGRGTQKSKVIIAVCVDDAGKPQRAKCQVVKNLRRKTVHGFLGENIAPGTKIRTDKYKIYEKLPDGYQHDSKISQPESEHLRWLHIITSNLKAFIQGTFHGLDSIHLQRYLEEFCWRFSRRYSRGNQFFSLLKTCVNSPAVTYAELTG